MERRYEQVPAIMKREAKMLKKASVPAIELGATITGAGLGFTMGGFYGAAVGGTVGRWATRDMFKKKKR